MNNDQPNNPLISPTSPLENPLVSPVSAVDQSTDTSVDELLAPAVIHDNSASPVETATPTSASPSATVLSADFRNPGRSEIESEDLRRAAETVKIISEAFSSRVVGQEGLKTALIVSMITGGHVLLESVPGLAKTTAAQTLAQSINASFKRIQCTPDLLPSDIIGTQIYDYAKGKFETQLGPVHANFILLDEINRSSAKTQSAMLEAMQEKQTSIGGQRYDLPKPFVVLATQNPIEQEGTYELPEAQLDRFLLKEILTYPTPEEELEVLKRIETGVLGAKPKEEGLPQVDINEIIRMQDIVQHVYIDDSIKNYIVQIVAATRNPRSVIAPEIAKYVQCGGSPRASSTFQGVAKALALINGRDYVIPEDVKQLRHSVLRHRILLNFEAIADQVHSEVIIDAIFNAITAP